MTWYQQPTVFIILGSLLLLIVIVVCLCNMSASNTNNGSTNMTVNRNVNKDTNDSNDVTLLEDSTNLALPVRSTNTNELQDSDTEDFGMYEGSLAAWLAKHHSNISVSRYTQSKKNQLYNVQSVNNPVPTIVDKCDYDKYTAPETQRYIRSS